MAVAPSSPIVAGRRRWRGRLGLWRSLFDVARAVAPSTPRAVAGVLKLVRGVPSRLGDRLAPKLAVAGGRHFLAPQLPGWPSAAWDRFVAGELGRYAGFGLHDTLQSALVALTPASPPLGARGAESAAPVGPEVLTLHDLTRLAHALVERGVTVLQLTGDEPLGRPEAIEAVGDAAASRADVWVVTSGLGLDAAMAARLAAAGITGVQVGLDHHRADGHDRLRRRPGAWDEAVAAVGQAQAAGLAVCLNLVARPGFAARADLDRYGAMARWLGVQFIQLLEPRAAGAWTGAELTLTPVELAGLEGWARAMNHHRPDMPLVTDLGAAQRRVGCWGAGDRYAYVDARGLLHACPSCPGPVGSAVDDLDGALARLAARGCPAYRPATPRAAARARPRPSGPT